MKVSRDGAEVTSSGRLLQMREAAVGNALSATVDSRVRNTISADFDDDFSRLPWNDVGYTSKFVTEIFRRQVMQTVVDKNRQYILDTLWYSQPVQVAKCSKWQNILHMMLNARVIFLMFVYGYKLCINAGLATSKWIHTWFDTEVSVQAEGTGIAGAANACNTSVPRTSSLVREAECSSSHLHHISVLASFIPFILVFRFRLTWHFWLDRFKDELVMCCMHACNGH